ncbi:hypothetical protein J4450_01885 [Candidatus Micrarchaeota archaeon]|nr:hypothetical protein [Candidatus Micrarchaeota archaeon]
MLDFPTQIYISLKTIFRNKKYIYLFIFLIIAAFVAYILIPVYTIPGNDLSFWLSIMPWWGYPIIFTFAVALGLLLTMKVYEFRHSHSVLSKAEDAGGVIAVIIAGLYTTAACGACISSLFAIVGASGALFLNQNRDIFIVLSVIITIIAIYFTAKKINSKCNVCTTQNR